MLTTAWLQYSSEFSMLNPKSNLWCWGPIDGRPIYPDAWYQGQTSNKRLYPPGWPPNFSLYKGTRYSFVTDDELVRHQAEKVFVRFILPTHSLRKAYHAWLGIVQRFLALNASIEPQKLKLLTDIELHQLVKKWFTLYSREFWGVGLLPELANLGGESLLTSAVEHRLTQREKNMEIIEKLSAPEKLSFYRVEERALLRLRSISDKRLLAAKLREHHRQYYWLLNSYHDTRVLPLSYFQKRLLSHSKLEARKKLGEIDRQVSRARQQKSKLIRKFGLGRGTLKLAHRLAFCIWWQDKRKSYIFQANHSIDVILCEAARRYRVSFADLHFYTFVDVLMLVRQGVRVAQREVVRRQKYFTVLWFPDKPTRYVSGTTARKFFEKYLPRHHSADVLQLRGQAVSSGLARGRVRVLLSSKQAGRMQRGEILVTTMTSPDFIVAMRKAAAVVTDVGGLTSHAAIVSRELKIPCIVGTRIATQVLNDGDKIEVDAANGIIRKL